MKNIFTQILVVFALITIVSCSKFADGVVHVVAFPDHTPRLAVTVISGDNDTTLIAQVTSTASVLDADGPQPVQGAVITLKLGEDAILYSMVEEDYTDFLYKLNLDETFGHYQGTMTLNVDAPGFDPVTATTEMPAKPEVEFTYVSQSDTLSTPWTGEIIQDSFTLNLVNNPDVDDTYLIYVDALYLDPYTLDTIGWKNVSLMTRNDPRISQHNTSGGLIISDETASSNSDGLSELMFLSESFIDQSKWSPVSLRLRVEALSPELAKYYASTDSYLNGGFDFFAEPSLIYSNISSGFGCFGLSSQTIVVVN